MSSLLVRVTVLTTAIVAVLLGATAFMVAESARGQITRESVDASRVAFLCNGSCVELRENVVLFDPRRNSQYSTAAIEPRLSLWPLSSPEKTEYNSIGVWYGARPLHIAPEAQRKLNYTVGLIIGIAATLTALTGVIVYGGVARVLQPVEDMRARLAQINEHSLTRRVPVPHSDNEIAKLAITMNETLDRVEKAVEDTRRFVADASHELRSPLAALRAELEIALSHPSLKDWPVVVKAALEDTERLQELTTDLLLLTRLDSDASVQQDAVDLTAVVQREVLRRRGDVELVADIDPRPVFVPGRRAQLSRLLGNLLDNAERHAESTVTVRLRGGFQATLEVTDDGPGIPLLDREKIFDRFTRLDDARTRDAGGSGLGLAIARRIAARHHGTLTAADAESRGIRFVATIPTGEPVRPTAVVPPQRTGDEVWQWLNGSIVATHHHIPEQPRQPEELDLAAIFGEHVPVPVLAEVLTDYAVGARYSRRFGEPVPGLVTLDGVDCPTR